MRTLEPDSPAPRKSRNGPTEGNRELQSLRENWILGLTCRLATPAAAGANLPVFNKTAFRPTSTVSFSHNESLILTRALQPNVTHFASAYQRTVSPGCVFRIPRQRTAGYPARRVAATASSIPRIENKSAPSPGPKCIAPPGWKNRLEPTQKQAAGRPLSASRLVGEKHTCNSRLHPIASITNPKSSGSPL